MSVLREYGDEKWERERSRVQLAALKLAGGNLDELERQTCAAKRDYRDVLAAAEYPEYTRRGMFHVPRMSLREQQRIIDSDWQQYDVWLRR
jgi:hypothetical protein